MSFALSGLLNCFEPDPQGVALGYLILPLWGRVVAVPNRGTTTELSPARSRDHFLRGRRATVCFFRARCNPLGHSWPTIHSRTSPASSRASRRETAADRLRWRAPSVRKLLPHAPSSERARKKLAPQKPRLASSSFLGASSQVSTHSNALWRPQGCSHRGSIARRTGLHADGCRRYKYPTHPSFLTRIIEGCICQADNRRAQEGRSNAFSYTAPRTD